MRKFIILLGVILLNISVSAQFEQCNSPTTKELRDVYFIDYNTGIAVGDSGIIMRSVDGGLNWDIVTDIDSISFNKVKFFDSLNGIVVGSDIYKTDDGGLTWTASELSNEFYDVAIINDSICIVSGYPLGLVKSFDRGNTWDTLQFQNPNKEIGLLSFINEDIGYASYPGFAIGGREMNTTLKTTDGGMTWDTINALSGNKYTILMAFNFISEDIGFRAGWYNGTLMKTTDGGVNWVDNNIIDTMNDIGDDMLDFHIQATMPDAYYACGWHGKMFKSFDGGDSWNILNTVISHSLNGVYFIDDLTGWLVGENNIYKTTDGGGLVEIVEIDNVSHIQIYPNPTKGIIQVDSKNKIEMISVFNIHGELQDVLTNEYSIDLSLSDRGMYFIQVETNKGNGVFKIILE